VSIKSDSKTSTGFTVVWDPPTKPKGVISSYRINIAFSEFNYFTPGYCPKYNRSDSGSRDADEALEYSFIHGVPFSKYQVQVRASSTKDGEWSETKEVVTNSSMFEWREIS
jgi:hypothetical protein